MTTLVLTGAFHDYRHVDLANVPYHLMNEEQVKRLNKDPELQKKIVPTLGVAGNLTRLRIQQEGNIPRFAEELAQYKTADRRSFFFGRPCRRPRNSVHDERRGKHLEKSARISKERF